MKIVPIAALMGCLLLTISVARGQGCSDAGFCTAGALQHTRPVDSLRESSIGISVTAGSGEQGTIITLPQVEWKQRLPYSLQLELKTSYYLASGNLASTSGIGDPMATLSKSWRATQDWRGFATAGVRVSLTAADERDRTAKPLPMPYQHGLGTTDVIVGLGMQYKRWLFLSAGYQQPFIHYNDNGYLADAFPLESDDYRAYFNSRKLRRQGDMLLRAEGTATRGHWALSGGPLLIYHLGNDRITTTSGDEMEVANSSGVTLNIAGRLTYALGRNRWALGGGSPLVVRQQRPDGLTRHWMLTLKYERTYVKK